MITDLTEGNITKKLWAFSLPMLISVMFQQIYNIADSVIAGKFVGEDALAAVGASQPITMIFIAVAMGSNIGCSVIISQLFGAKKLREMKTAISTTFIACAVLSVSLTILGLLFSGPMMRLINTPENIFKDASIYLNIYIGGLVFLFLYNVCTGIFNALGDSRTPLYFLIGSSVGNIILDIVFVTVIPLGVAGVAIATFIAQGISSILSIITLLRRLKKIEVNGKSELFSSNMLKKIAVVAIPSILQQSFISVGNLIIQSLVNGYGSAFVAGYSASMRIVTFAIASFTTLANGLSSFVAQNIGAGKLKRVSKGLHSAIVMAICVVIPFFVVCYFYDEQILRLFLNADSQEAISTGSDMLRITSPFFIMISVKLMIDGVFRGAKAMSWFMIVTFVDLLARVGLAYVIAYNFPTVSIWVSWPIGWGIAIVLSATFYITGVWKKALYKEIAASKI